LWWKGKELKGLKENSMPTIKTTNYPGINYGAPTTNLDLKTGIRYGVISSHSISPDAMDDFENDYGTPHCPKCGNDAIEIPNHIPKKYDDYETARGACGDYACENCEYLFDGDDAYSDEPIGWNYDQDGYKLTNCLTSDIFVLASPYYTYAQFCSPCVPGACNLDSPLDTDGIEYGYPDDYQNNRCYCLGPEWFDDENPMPYRCFKVIDGSEVTSE
jgi:hypothetical protein